MRCLNILILQLIFVFGILQIGFAQNLTLIQPKNDSYIQPDLQYLFSWNGLANATAYKLEIAEDIGFQTLIYQSTQTNNLYVSVSLNSGNFFWRIRAFTANGEQLSNFYQIHVYEPSIENDLTIWLDASKGVSLDGSSSVEKWSDSGPNNFQIQQTSSAKRPTLVQNVLNGLPALRFSGGQVLSGGDILDIGTASRSMFVVGKMNGTNQTFFAKSLLAGVPNRFALLKESNPYFLYSADTYGGAGCTMSGSKYALYSVCSDRAKSKNYFYIDNFCASTGNLSAQYNMNSTFRFLVGAYNNANDNGEVLFLNGDINEIVFVESADSMKFNRIQSYLRYKYSPPVNLGRDTTITSNICPINLSIPAGFTNITWSTGETSSSISTNKSGAYWVQATDIFGYVSSDTVLVNFPEAAPPNNNFICEGTTKIWDPLLPTSYTYAWSNGTSDTLLAVNQVGAYTLVYTDGNGCSKQSDNVVLALDTYPTTFSLGPDTTVCSGNVLYAKAKGAETISYSWQDGSTLAQYPVSNSGTYSVETTNTNGCLARDTISVVVSGVAPIASFELEDFCLGLTQQPADLSLPGSPSDVIVSWDWDFGDGITAQVQQPNYAPLTAGIRNVTLSIMSNGNCGAFITKQITIHQPPVANIGSTGMCSAEGIQFTDQSVLGSAPLTNWLWNFGQPSSGLANVSVVPNPTKIYGAAGSFSVTLSVKDEHACQHDTMKLVDVFWSPIADYNIPDTCVYANLAIKNLSTVNAPANLQNVLWTFGDNTLSNTFEPVKSFPNYGMHTIKLDVMTDQGCTATKQKQVYLHPLPVALFEVGPACKGTYTNLVDESTIPEGVITDYMWLINGQETLYGPKQEVVFDDDQQQQVQLFVTSEYGCQRMMNQFIEIPIELNADFDFSAPLVAATEPITLTNTSIGAEQISWDLGDGTTETSDVVIHKYADTWQDQMVEITLFVESFNGCKDTISKTLSVRPIVLDAKLNQLFIEQDGAFYNLGLSWKNTGSVTINSQIFKLSWVLGPLLEENWEGSLAPGASTIYIFNAKPTAFQFDQYEHNYICVDGIAGEDDGRIELLIEDNKVCALTKGEGPYLMLPYPNPAQDHVSIGFVLTEKTTSLSLGLYDALGHELINFYRQSSLTEGAHFIQHDCSQLASGMYYLKLTVDGRQVIRQLVVR